MRSSNDIQLAISNQEGLMSSTNFGNLVSDEEKEDEANGVHVEGLEDATTLWVVC